MRLIRFLRVLAPTAALLCVATVVVTVAAASPGDRIVFWGDMRLAGVVIPDFKPRGLSVRYRPSAAVKGDLRVKNTTGTQVFALDLGVQPAYQSQTAEWAALPSVPAGKYSATLTLVDTADANHMMSVDIPVTLEAPPAPPKGVTGKSINPGGAWETEHAIEVAVASRPFAVLKCVEQTCGVVNGLPFGYENRKLGVASVRARGIGALTTIKGVRRYQAFRIKICSIDYQSGGQRQPLQVKWYTRVGSRPAYSAIVPRLGPSYNGPGC